MQDQLIYGIGFIAQGLFASRLLVQWIKSEQAGRVLSPTLFWQLSIVASALLMVYGILRDDPVILLGQVISYAIYIRNLQFKNAWKLIPDYFKILVVLFPIAAVGWLIFGSSHNWFQIFLNNNISGFVLTIGSIGQVIFNLRFVVQIYHSEKAKASKLTMGFWVTSIVGSLLILAYAIVRLDPVLLAGQSFGSIIYARNIFLLIKEKSKKVKKEIQQ